jgi:hypothetical protein
MHSDKPVDAHADEKKHDGLFDPCPVAAWENFGHRNAPALRFICRQYTLESP